MVWAHNSHLGDARATETGARGELNVGQLVRERHGGACRSIGFTTYNGTVTAADRLGRPGRTASGCGRPCPAASRSCSTRPASTQFLLRFDERVAGRRR